VNSLTLPRKTRIILTDYPYRRDIENRLLLSHLSVLEVDLLIEILHCSLQISIHQLAESLDVEIDDLIPTLDKLAPMKLYKRNGDMLTVDKEMRKYYEIQLEKFDEDFEPNLEFLQSLLNKVPIHVLPLWYAIPRHSDNIFASIIENYFLTPKIYRQYLDELEFDDPLLANITEDIYKAPGYKILAQTLIDKYHLTREAFEEALLLLEYHFVCCLSYTKKGDYWEETVTPFYEWHQFLLHESKGIPKTILNQAIQPRCKEEFGFIKEMEAVILACQSNKRARSAFKPLFLQTAQEFDLLLDKVLEAGFIAEEKNNSLYATEKGLLWLKKNLSEQINEIISLWLTNPPSSSVAPHLWTARNVRLIEKYLKKLRPNDWVFLNDFISGFISPIGNKEPVTLKNKGKKWKYMLPTYDGEELDYIAQVITERFYELGVVSIGQLDGKICFCLTQFGHQFIN
jgi:hypothetical protein